MVLPFREPLQQKQANKKVTGLTWIHGGSSIIVCIPKVLARKHGLDTPGTVLFEDCEDGIKIRPLRLPS